MPKRKSKPTQKQSPETGTINQPVSGAMVSGNTIVGTNHGSIAVCGNHEQRLNEIVGKMIEEMLSELEDP